jgi:hypothetical protein
MNTDSQKHRQVGGDHYSKMAVTPFELGQANQYDPTLFTSIKYALRFKDKGGVEDLRKGLHCLDIREEFIGVFGPPRPALDVIPMSHALVANSIPIGSNHAYLLIHLHQLGVSPDEAILEACKSYFVRVIEQYYPKGEGE